MKYQLLNHMKRRRTVKVDIAERSYFQYNMLRSLAFGERDWVVFYSLFCALHDAPRDVWTIMGITGLVLGMILLGPIYGVFIHMITKWLYYRRKAKSTLPKNWKWLTWHAQAFCFPVILGLSWLTFDLYFDSMETIWTLPDFNFGL